MKKEEVIKYVEEKGDTSYVIRTENDDKSFLDNYRKTVIEAELDPQVAKIHNQYDEDLYNLFGERKKPGEKTYKFMKDKFGTLKEKAEKVEALEAEVAELKKGSPDDSARLREIKELQKQINVLKETHEAELTKFAKQTLKNSVKSEIERGLLNIKVKESIPDTVKSVYVDSIINELSERAEVRDGKIVFLDKEGKALRDPATLAEYSAEALLRERMKDIIDVAKPPVKGPGIGNEPPVTKDKDGKLLMNFAIPGTVKNREQLGEYLVKDLGIKRHTAEYREAYARFAEAYPAI